MANPSLKKRSAGRARLWLAAVSCWAGAALAQGNETMPAAIDNATAQETASGLFEARLEYQQSIDRRDYAATVELGRQLREMTEAQFGAESREAAGALLDLAKALSLNAQYEQSEETYLRAADLHRAIDGVYAAGLIPTLTGLGDNYSAGDQHVNAITAYDEARSITRRLNGLLNNDQIALLDRISSSFIEVGDFDGAQEQQLVALQIVNRQHEPQSAEALNALFKYADWLRSVSRHAMARDQYRTGIRIINEHHGNDSPILIEPLRQIANSFRFEGLRVETAYAGLLRALDILRVADVDDPLTEAIVLRDAGDWHTVFESSSLTHAEYTRAWRLLGGGSDGLALREQWFGGLNYIYRAPMSTCRVDDEASFEGYAIASLGIGADGRARHPRIVEADPPGLRDEDVLRHILSSRFRPRIDEAGMLIAVDDFALLRFDYVCRGNEDAD